METSFSEFLTAWTVASESYLGLLQQTSKMLVQKIQANTLFYPLCFDSI